MATTINASTSAGLVSTADTSGVLQLQAANTTVLNAELGKALALQGATSTTGCGIAFPATQVTSTDANTLDDYEEGTWTPSVGGTATYGGSNAGKYTKIGNTVILTGQIQITTIGTGSTTLISGLPFNASGTSGNCGATGYSASLAVTVASLTTQISSSTASLNFGSRSITGTYTEVTAIFQNSSRMDFSIMYQIT